MIQKILFAVGDDAASDAAVPVVAAYARQLSAGVHVLHAHRIGEDRGNGQLRRLLKAVRERLEAEGVHTSGEVRLVRKSGAIAAVVTKVALDTEAELVAVGSRGRTDLGGLFLGSVSHRVAARLDLPVLVVRTSPALQMPPRTLLVATDGSAASDRAIAEAAEMAWRTGATLTVVHVRELVTTEAGAFVEADAEANETLNRGVAGARAAGVQAEGEIVISQTGVVEAIASVAERLDADLVVIASRRPSDLSGLLLGSVAHGLIHRLSRPVLLASRVPASERVGA
jgi:nucleotide-binding universal stress UspA family protein